MSDVSFYSEESPSGSLVASQPANMFPWSTYVYIFMSVIIFPVSHQTDGRRLQALDVRLQIQDRYVVMDNGIVQVTLSNPQGGVTGLKYNNVDNLLEPREEEHKGYWDLDWSENGKDRNGLHDRIDGTVFTVVKNTPVQVELSFFRAYVPTETNSVPLNIDIRYVLLRGSSGFYSYAIYEHLMGWPAFNLHQTRMAFKLSTEKFHHMIISDRRQRDMPLAEDREKGQVLEYKEAVLLTNPSDPQFKGEVDCKYQYSCENKDCKVHGWISSNSSIGFWTIIPSNEFQSGGPFKQDLTSHAGPTTLAMFHSLHYGGEDVVLKIQNTEYWKKVYGPVFFYLNTAAGGAPKDVYGKLWQDAKRQMMVEVKNWPYSFPVSKDNIQSSQRGIVTGRLQVQDLFINKNNIPASYAYVGLAPVGDIGSWQREGKGYQFWTTANTNGEFYINNIRPGEYNLFAYVPHFIGDFRHSLLITVTPGGFINVGNIVYKPPRDGPTLWEIGIPDRSAAEFFIPDPVKKYINRLYIGHVNHAGRWLAPVDKFRQYGLWGKYAELHPRGDLIYTVGKSNWARDWFYAHVNRKSSVGALQPTTRQLLFNLANVVPNRGNYKLRLALASATNADIHVRVNNPGAISPLFRTGLIGKDNAIARHGIHGLYWLFSIDVPSNLLRPGSNTIYLTQTRSITPFQGVMYDYVRLEEPATSNNFNHVFQMSS